MGTIKDVMQREMRKVFGFLNDLPANGNEPFTL